jgi:hypothetical protein
VVHAYRRIPKRRTFIGCISIELKRRLVKMNIVKRSVVLLGGVLIVWGSLAYRFITDTDRTERAIAIVFGIGVTLLAVAIARGPVLPKSRGWDDGGEGDG